MSILYNFFNKLKGEREREREVQNRNDYCDGELQRKVNYKVKKYR